MSRNCASCSQRGDLTDVTVTDSSGGALGRLCGRCLELLKHDRCGLCGAPKVGESKAEYVFEHGSGEPAAPICDACRMKVLNNTRGSR